MKILVTGGAGFIGSHTVDALVEGGHKVFVIDNLSAGQKGNLNPRVKFYEIDIRDRGVEAVFNEEKPGIIFHFAAQINLRRSIEDPVFDAESNILGSLNLLECARKHGVKRFIFSSTGGAIYGEVKQIPTPESCPPTPTSPYGLAKLTVERYLEIWRQVHGLDYTALRYANVYGPRQSTKAEAGVIAIFVEKILQGEQPTINGDGRQTRDYVYVGDVVEANLAALNDKEGGVYNIGTGIEMSVNEIYRKITDHLMIKSPAVHGPAIKGELLRSALDSKRAKERLDWGPETSLEVGLAKTIEFFRSKAEQ